MSYVFQQDTPYVPISDSPIPICDISNLQILVFSNKQMLKFLFPIFHRKTDKTSILLVVWYLKFYFFLFVFFSLPYVFKYEHVDVPISEFRHFGIRKYVPMFSNKEHHMFWFSIPQFRIYE